MTNTESKAVRELIAACEKVIAWLDRQAIASENRAKDRRSYASDGSHVITLAEADETAARNYRATSADLRKAIRKASGVLK
jgi:hypothetical protein